MLTPEFAGTRYGAAELSDAGGVIATALPLRHGIRPHNWPSAPSIISTVAGNGTYGFSGDGGPATSAELERPFGVAVDSAGNLYIADDVDNRIRKVTPDGTITTVAGNGSCAIVVDYGCYSGDGGPATSAELRALPYGVAVDGAGNLYIADADNHTRPQSDAGRDNHHRGRHRGMATAATVAQPPARNVSRPLAVAVDGAGNLYIADSRRSAHPQGGRQHRCNQHRGRKRNCWLQRRQLATSAELYQPYGVAVDGAGNLYIADQSTTASAR